MASIQQSVNQTLGSTQFAAGIYAHTPMGKKAASLQDLSRQERDINKRIKVEGEKLNEAGANEDKILSDYTRHLKGLAKIGKQRYKIDPSEEAYESMISRQAELDDWKETMKELKNLGGTTNGK